MSTRGLEGIVVAETRLSKVYGEEGRLIYSGYEIQDLAESVSYEEVCHLLWYGELPTRTELEELGGRFRAERSLPGGVLEVLRSLPGGTHPMSALRTAVSVLGAHDAEAEAMDAESNLRKAIRLTAQLSTATAAFERIRRGEDPLAPRDDLGHAANFLYMVNGRTPTDVETRTMDAALTLHAEHGMNASTFAARVTVATLSDMHSGVTSAIGTLKGPLHGGANQRVMAMLEAIGTEDAVDGWVRAALERGERIMGFGHRVYKALDPRAPILQRLAERLATGSGDARWLRIANRIVEVMGEEMARRQKPIYPNVDFFSAPVYHTLGVPADAFTNVFACARVAGWTAHIREQLADNRLIRPRGEYVGPGARRIVPIGQRP